jgi:hypothetical protein
LLFFSIRQIIISALGLLFFRRRQIIISAIGMLFSIIHGENQMIFTILHNKSLRKNGLKSIKTIASQIKIALTFDIR